MMAPSSPWAMYVYTPVCIEIVMAGFPDGYLAIFKQINVYCVASTVTLYNQSLSVMTGNMSQLAHSN